MITIITEKRYLSKSTKYVLRITGHANYGEKGKDIVCAGVSTLAQAWIVYLEKHGCDITDLYVTEGDIFVSVKGETKVIEPSFDMMNLGFEGIAEVYPENVYLCGEK